MTSIDTEKEWLRNEIIPRLLREQKFRHAITPNELDKFQLRDVSVDLIGAQEAFMLTSCYRACVTYEFKGAVDKIHIFVKKTPKLPQQMFDVINFKALFTNEILGYSTIMPYVEKFGNLKLNLTKFLCANLETDSAILITEDFSSLGWKLTKERVNLSIEHILLAVKYLAKFHAAAFALRITDRKKFDVLTKDLKESRYSTNELHPQWEIQVKTSIRRTIKVTNDYYKDIPQEYLDKFAKFENTFLPFCKQMVQPIEPMVTLCHGDYLRNNMAFRYEEKDNGIESPIDIMMFDLQTLRVASPMIDVVTFMCLSSFAEVRQKNFTVIFESYYKELKETYERIAQQSLPDYLSFDCLLKEYIRCLPYGILVAAPFLGVIMEPIDISTEEMLMEQISYEQLVERAMARGGEQLDRELAQQLKELYDLSKEHNIKVF